MPKFPKMPQRLGPKPAPVVTQIGGYTRSVITEPHKRLNRSVQVTTLHKTDKTKMSFNDIKGLAEALQKANPKKKLMIKVLSSMGHFQLLNYGDSIDQILTEEEYINGREDIGAESVYKASFYLL